MKSPNRRVALGAASAQRTGRAGCTRAAPSAQAGTCSSPTGSCRPQRSRRAPLRARALRRAGTGGRRWLGLGFLARAATATASCRSAGSPRRAPGRRRARSASRRPAPARARSAPAGAAASPTTAPGIAATIWSGVPGPATAVRPAPAPRPRARPRRGRSSPAPPRRRPPPPPAISHHRPDRLTGSTPVVGSSRISRSGWCSRAAITPSFCRMPPESCPASRSARRGQAGLGDQLGGPLAAPATPAARRRWRGRPGSRPRSGPGRCRNSAGR